MTIREATARYEAWLGEHLTLIPQDLALKHQSMREAVFPFLRATYYRWAQQWSEVCEEAAAAPAVLSVGDLHVENFGTWRDNEGRLVWGINDFDEAWWLPYTSDLVRLAASALLADRENDLAIDPNRVDVAILEGYQEALECGGSPIVLAEHHGALREMAVERLKNPVRFWEKLEAQTSPVKKVPGTARKVIERALPEPDLECRWAHRRAGLGSLGRERFVAIAEWRGAKIVREAKAAAPSACRWAEKGGGTAKILGEEALECAVRCPDPFVHIRKGWVVRRLAADCSRIELSALPREHDEHRLLRAMGFETANVHLGSRRASAIKKDLSRRSTGWLRRAAKWMVEAVEQDWKAWRRGAK